MIYKQNLCVKCSEAITNPICGRCHMQQVQHWLRDINVNPILGKLIAGKIKQEVAKDTLNETTCIVCGKETLSSCSYCFFLAVTRVLQELNFPLNIVENFLEIFNYRHSHEEYAL